MITENNEIRNAWEFVEHTGKSIFLTGKAGTGKTTFLRHVKAHSTKRMVVVAPTGVAAINAEGMTIHSFFQLPLSPYVPGSSMKQKYDFSKEKRKIIASLDLLVIDEISMVRSDLLDAIDAVLRRFRDRYRPFGGLQLLMIGDLQQLTPVVTPEDAEILDHYYDTPYFFGSKALQQTEYVTIQLEHVYRQSDQTFVDILNRIRQGCPTPLDLQTLNERYVPQFSPKTEEGYIRLTTHNNIASRINNEQLGALHSTAHTYQAEIEGTFPEYSYPTDVTLTLKEGAQVMFIKNDTSGEHRFFNGKIGHVSHVDETEIKVVCDGEEEIAVEKQEWENAKYVLNEETKEIETRVQGVFRQHPLRLAWAITIHKSQGLTFERAIIDTAFSFAPGQVYVALSRCRSIEGMILASPIVQKAIINDMRVDSYIVHQQQEAQASIDRLPVLKEEYHRSLLMDLFDFRPLLYKEEYMCRLMTEYFAHTYSSVTQLHKEVTDNLKKKVTEVADKWRGMILSLGTEALHEEDFRQRVKRSADYFLNTLQQLFAKPMEVTKRVNSKNKEAIKRLEETYTELRCLLLTHYYILGKLRTVEFDVKTYLKVKHHAQLEAMDTINGKSKPAKKEKKKEKPAKEKTWVVTYQLFKEGLMPQEIAIRRSLTLGTIYSHLSRYIESGEIGLEDVIELEKLSTILRAIKLCKPEDGRTGIKTLCPPDISFADISLVLSAMKTPQ